MLEEGRYRSAAEIAEAEGVTRSFVNRLLRLTLLAPEIVEVILDGRKGLQLAVLTGKLPSAWEEQRQLLPTTFARWLDRTSTNTAEPRCARQSPADAGL
jgi:hypothetical protein